MGLNMVPYFLLEGSEVWVLGLYGFLFKGPYSGNT